VTAPVLKGKNRTTHRGKILPQKKKKLISNEKKNTPKHNSLKRKRNDSEDSEDSEDKEEKEEEEVPKKKKI